jgi:hypothetical protein
MFAVEDASWLGPRSERPSECRYRELRESMAEDETADNAFARAMHGESDFENVFTGDVSMNSLYGGGDPVKGFRRSLDKAEKRAAMLPSW